MFLTFQKTNIFRLETNKNELKKNLTTVRFNIDKLNTKTTKSKGKSYLINSFL